ncbi:MAG: type toxin-antitoxin system prevent-host-death family antitoxin [Desulfacinum sp.]|nr:type toxin-antitoxin system prevent-host-death family antitoxin [Desulfacinum sp.]
MEAAVEKGTWQVQEVKSRLSHVLENARKFGPQIITKHGKKVAVILSYEDYTRHRRAHSSLVDFFAGSPLKGIDLDDLRQKDPPREVVL